VQDLEYLCATSSDDSPFTLWEELGDAYLGLGHPEKSIDAYKRDAERYPDVVIAYQNLGEAFLASGSNQNAVKELLKAMRLMKEKKTSLRNEYFFELGCIHRNLSVAYQGLGRDADAREHLAKAAEAYTEAFALPLEPWAEGTNWRSTGRHHARYGELLERLGQLDKAKVQYTQAVQIFDKTTYEEDDELEISEGREAAESLARLTADPPQPLSEVDETTKKFRRGRHIAQKTRTNWGVEEGKEPPRRRGT
jgi:tetratricopeptide (TPR) repeat protein